MTEYSVIQWAVCFYIYGFLGWVWESCFVSIRLRKWINRGFLNGPILPIYGFGAVLILILTSSVSGADWAIFLTGMAGATALEYITGYSLEKLFDVRYWDYSSQRFNVNGYICLKCSLCWGIFALLLRRKINPCIEAVIRMAPEETLWMAGTLISILFVIDVAFSVNEAISLKKMFQFQYVPKPEVRNLKKQFAEWSITIRLISSSFSPK